MLSVNETTVKRWIRTFDVTVSSKRFWAIRVVAKTWLNADPDRVLDRFHVERPDLIAVVDGHFVIAELKANSAIIWRDTLRHEFSMRELLSPWVAQFGYPEGVAAELIATLRSAFRGVRPLVPEPGFPIVDVPSAPFHRFLHLFALELETDVSSLEFVADVLGLNTTEVAHLFGVRRQAVDQWRQRGISPERAEKLEAVRQVTSLLRRYMRTDAIRGMARTHATAYGGLTMLEMIAASRHQELFALTARSFDFAAAA